MTVGGNHNYTIIMVYYVNITIVTFTITHLLQLYFSLIFPYLCKFFSLWVSDNLHTTYLWKGCIKVCSISYGKLVTLVFAALPKYFLNSSMSIDKTCRKFCVPCTHIDLYAHYHVYTYTCMLQCTHVDYGNFDRHK